MATTYINNNVKFHAFSKSPVSPETTLGGAVNPSGHTITTSQVRSQDIPAFLNTFQGTKDTAITWLGTNYATPAHNDIAYYGGEFKAGFDTPKCLKYNGKTSTWEDFDLKYTDRANNVLRTTLKNADDKDVLAIHQDCTTVFVDGGNNAATNSNRWSLFVKKADGSILDHFVASTDKIVAGMPSLGYNALVMLNNAAIDEGELDANYVGNTFAGIIHLNKQYANGDDAKFKVTCFEYIGDKLDTSLSDIRKDVQDIIGTTMEGVVASITVSDAATSAGISVIDTNETGEGTKTSPQIDITTATITDGVFATTTGNKAKLVTAADVESYVSKNAKVSVNGQGATTISVAGTTQGSSDLVKVVVTEDKDTANEIGLTLTATADVATVTSGVITSGHEGKLVKAGDAKAIAEKAIESAIADGGTIDGRIDTLISNATSTSAIVDNDTSTKLVTAKQVSDYVASEVGAIDVGVVSVIIDENEIPDGVRLGDDFQNRKLSIWTPPVQYAETHKDTNYLVTASFASTLATNAGNAAVNTINGKSLTSLASSTQGSYVTVTTSGTVGSGLTVNVNDSALASTVSAAASAIQGITINGGTDNELVKVGDGNIVDITLPSNAVAGGESHGIWFSTNEAPDNSELGSGYSGHYLHISAATYSPNTNTWLDNGDNDTSDFFTTASTVESFVNATVGADLAALQSKVNAYHEAGVSYKVHTDTTLPDLSVEQNVENYKNVILLVPSLSDGTESSDETAAITGGYVEWLCVNKGTKEAPSWDWEQIGTTEADLHGYVSQIHNDNNIDSHTSPVYASISSDGYLTLGIDSATSDKLGVSKMFSGTINANSGTATDTAVSVKSASELYTTIASSLNNKADAYDVVRSVNGVKGPINLCVHNAPDYGSTQIEGTVYNPSVVPHANLWGMGIATGDEAGRGQTLAIIDTFVGMSSSYLTTANLPSDAVSVENNFVMRADGEVITTIRPERMVSGFDATYATDLKSFVGDLSNLETCLLYSSSSSNVSATFYLSNALETFIGDLSSLKDGGQMFSDCSSLTTFVGDLSSLERGAREAHQHAGYMFRNTALTIESVENIADTLPENPVVDTNTCKGCIGISWHKLASDTAERQEIVNALSSILDKGWVLLTNTELLTMFDTEKYNVVEYTVQPLDLDREPQEIAYVIKK